MWAMGSPGAIFMRKNENAVIPMTRGIAKRSLLRI
jgi:hypothetical protein